MKNANNIIVVMPTYNERNNIVKMINAINALNLPIDILVVDDNSPDGTGELVESIKKSRTNLDIIHRKKKEGLGPAYREAFRFILNKDKYGYIIHMDADMSHSPKYIPILLEAIKKYDVAIGSRYVKGGAVSDLWNVPRKFLSRVGNFYAQIITGLKLKDCTGGFRCYRNQALKSIDFNKRFLNGYGFLIQMLYETSKNGFKIYEIPIYFAERERDLSKMNLSIMIEACLSLPLMRLRDLLNIK